MLARVATYFRAHHLALLALFVALGGTSYAAIELPQRLAPLERGETIRGVVAVAGGDAKQASGAAGVSFPVAAPRAIDSSHVDVDSLEESEDRCTGSARNPTAPEGVVCVYLRYSTGVDQVRGVGAPNPSGSRYGFGLAWLTTGSGQHAVSGTWAYTP